MERMARESMELPSANVTQIRQAIHTVLTMSAVESSCSEDSRRCTVAEKLPRNVRGGVSKK
jgi:hypothetical protein